jgi:hypothetical protein
MLAIVRTRSRECTEICRLQRVLLLRTNTSGPERTASAAIAAIVLSDTFILRSSAESRADEFVGGRLARFL